jgi:hypothetical protein
MKHNRPSTFPSRYIVYSLTGLAIFLMAFSGLPLPGSANKAAGPAAADIKVLGTSNVHDWSMEDKDVNCTATFIYEGKAPMPTKLTVFTFSFPRSFPKERQIRDGFESL